ncbi:MAG: hypothetical protein JWO82_2991 [Akkermansiaceae bacterium]|nr:hypothetical protein [Akkermansiaceae bacterium]
MRPSTRAGFRERSRRIKLLLASGYIRHASEIPEDALPIDPEKSTWVMGWGRGTYYYEDRDFTCRDCGVAERWTAESQATYFEVLQASRDKEPVRCYACRAKELERKQQARRAAGHPESTGREKPPNTGL